MARLACAILGCILLCAFTASAEWFENGVEVSDEAWRRSDADFGAMLLLTDDLDDFLAQWSRPAAAGYRPKISTTNAAAQGQTVTAIVLLHGCTPAESGRCRTVVDYRVERPDGSIYADSESVPLWVGEPPPGHNLQLGMARLVFEVEPDDPVGTYRIMARPRDLVSMRSMVLTQELRVEAASPSPRTSAPASP